MDAPEESAGSPIDLTSRLGKFAWETFGTSTYLPYLLRYGKKYIAVRMVEKVLLNKYVDSLHSSIYSYVRIQGYFITICEARLLNEINFKHMDGFFGEQFFTINDLVIDLQDAIELYSYLIFCHNKITDFHCHLESRCGYVQMENLIIPYVKKNGDKFVPVFFFKVELESSKDKILKLEGWDLSYLKFHCDMIGMKHEHCPKDNWPVVDLTVIQKLKNPDFKEYTPTKIVNSHDLIKNNFGPTIPWYITSNESYIDSQVKKLGEKSSINRTCYIESTSSKSLHEAETIASSFETRLVGSSSNSSKAKHSLSKVDDSIYEDRVSRQQCQDASLNPMTSACPGITYRSLTIPSLIGMKRSSSCTEKESLQSKVDKNVPSEDCESRGTEFSSSLKGSRKKYPQDNRNPNIQNVSDSPQPNVEDLPSCSSEETPRKKRIAHQLKIMNYLPFKVWKILLDKKTIPCINANPNDHKTLLLTVKDFVDCLFPTISYDKCRKILQDLDITLHSVTTDQKIVLQEFDKFKYKKEPITVILVEDVVKHMSVLKSTIQKYTDSSEDLVAKRHKK